MRQKLEVIEGPAAGTSYMVADGQSLKIGRGQASDTQLPDPKISRVHCIVEVIGGTARVRDNKSTAGTRVGGESITDQILKPGDVIHIGDSKIRYSLGTEQATIVAGSAKKPSSQELPTKLQDLVGQTLGNFHLDEIITLGNSGMVFRGTETTKNIPVAVKVLTPDPGASEEQKERFVRAMKTMLPIRHPHIVRLYNAGKKGPFCWAAMEYIDGESLTSVIDRIGIEGMLDWKEVWRMGMHIASALQEAYSHKIIHRNVTPTNILRRKDKACVLGDLVLAKSLEGTLAKQVTQPGQIVGDLAYMAPERTITDAEVDSRADLYGLGATMYALLTGRPPAEGESLPVIIKNIRDEVPESPKKYQLAVNEKFSDVVMRLLEKRPDDRYQTPAALIKDLNRIGTFNNLTA